MDELLQVFQITLFARTQKATKEKFIQHI